MTDPDTPAAARTLLRRLDGWSVLGPRPATGRVDFTVLSAAQDDRGVRRRVAVTETVRSCGMRAAHPDGRWWCAVWVSRPGRGWALDSAWARTRSEWASGLPIAELAATALKAYVGAPDLAAALAACAPTTEQNGVAA